MKKMKLAPAFLSALTFLSDCARSVNTHRQYIRCLVFSVCLVMFISCEKEDEYTRNSHTLPVVEIDIDEKYLWSPDSGLYIIGSNGINMDCSLTLAPNYNQKWEFPATMRYFPENTDVPAFEYDVGFRIKGNCSRRKAMKSIGLYWRDAYGSSNFSYPLFPGSETHTFKRLLLRNSGNDFGLTQMKDAAVVQIIREHAKVEYQEYRPVILYLNGEYWGIHNLREHITPHHFKYHYGVDDERVDLLEGSILSPGADDGSCECFLQEVIQYSQGHDLAEDSCYQAIAGRIDIENIIDYFIVETYIGNRDWPVTNTKWWRENTQNGSFTKWRWICYDMDASFLPECVHRLWLGDLYGEDIHSSKDDGFYLFNQLIRNEEFKREFLKRYRYFICHVFDPDRVEQIIKGMKETVAPEYPRHQQRWNTLPVKQWEAAVDEIIHVNRERNAFVGEIINGLYDAL